jgi:hypothetical protein
MIKQGMTNDEKREYFRSLATAPEQSTTVVSITRKAAPKPALSPVTESADTSVVAITPAPEATPQEQAQARLNEMAAPAEKPSPQSAQEKAAMAVKQVSAMFEPFRDGNDNFYIKQGGDAVMIGTTHCVDIIRSAVMNESGRVIQKDMLDQVHTVLRQMARAAPARAVYQRIGIDGDGYLFDLGDTARRCVRIDANGVSIIPCASTAANFSRGNGYGEMPEPVMPQDAAEAWVSLAPLLQGLKPRDHLPLISAKVEHLRPDSPNHILIATGAPGNGKTSFQRRCMLVTDPFTGDPPSVRADEADITAAAQSRYALLMDNLRGAVGGEIEDLLCRSSYGGATTIRVLYETAQARTLPLRAAWHLTGIGSVVRQDDTLDRALVMRINQPPAGAYKSESQARREFERELPRVFGGLLFFLALRMREAPAIEAQQTITHRMYDFIVTGEAIAQALGVAPGKFADSRKTARKVAAEDWIEGDGFAGPLVAALADIGKAAQPANALPSARVVIQAGRWVGRVNGRVMIAATAKALCDAVRSKCTFDGPEPPTSARATVGAVDRVHGEMVKAGWHVEQMGSSNKYWLFGEPT